MKRLVLGVAICALVLGGWSVWSAAYPKENWPAIAWTPVELAEAKAKHDEFIAKGHAPKSIPTYESSGSYMGVGPLRNWTTTESRIFDAQGLPKVKYGNYYYYNPVTMSHFIHSGYGDCIRNQDCKMFLTAVKKLQSMQSADGAFRYSFGWKHKRMPTAFKTGWVSGMAQGMALSSFARAYTYTKDEQYLQAGNKAFEFMMKPIEEGGTTTTLRDLDPSLDGYVFYAEYLTQPAAYTLNGFMFALIGIYDWWKVADSAEAKLAFEKGIKTLRKILPYYDMGNITTYDLSHRTMAIPLPDRFYPVLPYIDPTYHQVHIELLQVMFLISGDDIFKTYAEKWHSYVSSQSLYSN